MRSPFRLDFVGALLLVEMKERLFIAKKMTLSFFENIK